ncbi:MAG: OFA family MFS transporter [Candidatus Adiutrix sp.]|jgi:OFA family oxalate/formate antiporter-like MFS transporter|nr:OFA family MFS transporter [Candidatus Adiutrix sp.]
MTEKDYPNRWAIAIAGIVMQACLGTVYAWSVFVKPLMDNHGWTRADITIAFTMVIVVLSLAAAVGGYILDTKGPRIVATIGGILFGLGILITGYGDKIGSLTVIYLGYGLICGIGLGFGYITPIATLVKWFPDKRGLITGLAVMGFGLGSGLMAALAPGMIVSMGVATTLYIFGAIFLVAVVAAGQLMIAPPVGYAPAGWTPTASAPTAGATLGEAVRTKYFYLFWLMLFINITAGMAVISQASPMAQELMTDSVADKAKLAGALMLLFAIFNGIGRLFWASISDKIGRRQVFYTLFITQAIVFYVLYTSSSLTIFIILGCYIYACLGGGFATMPAYAADTFGTKYVGRIYGWMLTAWGAAGIVGPMLYAQIRQSAGDYKQALLITAFMFVIALIIPALATPKKVA